MRDEDDDARSETVKFGPTSGRVTGVLGLVVVAVVAVVGVVDQGADVAPWLLAGCAFVAVLTWVVLLRPDARVERGELVLRGPLDVRRVPLASVDQVAVGAVLAVTAGGRRYTNAGIGRTRRQTRKDAGKPLEDQSYGALVQSRIEALAERARLDHDAAGAVRREWAWPEIAALAVTGAALLVTLFV